MQSSIHNDEEELNTKFRRFYDSKNYNRFLVFILAVNYFCRVLGYFLEDRQFIPDPVHWLFTFMFALDVILNMATHSAREYWSSPWNVLMFIVVFLTTFLDLFLIKFGETYKALEACNRILKLFRVIEFFKRVTMLNEIASNLVRLYKILFTAVFTILFLAFTYAAIIWESFGTSKIPDGSGQWKLGSFYEVVALVRTFDAQNFVDQYKVCKKIHGCDSGLLALSFMIYYVLVALFMIEILSSIFVEGYMASAEEAESLAEEADIKKDYERYIKEPDGSLPTFFDDRVREYFKKKHDLNEDETLAVCEIFDENKTYKLSAREFTKLRKYLEDDIGKKVCLYQIQMLKLIDEKLDSILPEIPQSRRRSSFHSYQENLKKLTSKKTRSAQLNSGSTRV